ncbi:MAG: septum formation initiator family protein [Christensenella sp.]|nr:septum formation initiator family protein [Christensenella sp.]
MPEKKKKSFRFGRIKAIILICVLVYASLTFFNQQNILASQSQKQAELLAKEQELSDQIDYYKNELDYIGSSDYIEQEARDRLGWVMPGETKFIEDSGSSPSPESAAQPTSTPEPSPTVAPDPQPSASP